MGDVHPSGNPHFWLSPTALAQASEEVKETLARIDPSHAEFYRTRATEFKKQMKELEDAGRERFKKAGVVGESLSTPAFIDTFKFTISSQNLPPTKFLLC
jgi:ABC-type Zn uptake system ZnuABC Zn-binding protein ZnuA